MRVDPGHRQDAPVEPIAQAFRERREVGRQSGGSFRRQYVWRLHCLSQLQSGRKYGDASALFRFREAYFARSSPAVGLAGDEIHAVVEAKRRLRTSASHPGEARDKSVVKWNNQISGGPPEDDRTGGEIFGRNEYSR
jgi:hypothetical protein